MWQRIQTLWLLLAGVAMTITLIVPLAVSSMGVTFSTIGFFGGGYNYPTWGLFALAALITGLCFLTIFLFKRRKLQMRLSIFNILLIIGYLIYYVVLYASYGKSILPEVGEDTLTPSLWLLLPLLSIVLLYLAFKGIRKDEIIIRMSKRLR